MSWQLWVLVAVVAGGVTSILVAKFWQAQQVFDRIVRQVDDGRADELARQRSRREPIHRRPGNLHHRVTTPHIASQTRRNP